MPARLPALIRLLRPHQWAKNLLVFVALFTSHGWRDPAALRAAAIAFLAFCLTASAVYVVNDVLDLDADRAHPDKRERPFASGALSTAWAWPLAPLLFALALTMAWTLPLAARIELALYAVLALAYCLLLKRLLWLDVLALAALYGLRVVAGAHAIDVLPSSWLLAFALFVFFSLGALKRYAELSLAQGKDLDGRAYRAQDALPILALGAASALTAVLVLALYVNSPEVRVLYRQPAWIWLLCPLLLYWLARLWTLAERGVVRADPLLFALRDPASLLVGAATLSVVLAAL
jgi:4-hydroxybenzoate polyprenyltransferase